ncbi:methylated-DNA--[protein]-cysteine S-methyltransferase [Roseiconus nitratireducens]|nr:methylated-DNA--[protein]-cysteine S-methyltransferase [Roseiconus nitratireducens]
MKFASTFSTPLGPLSAAWTQRGLWSLAWAESDSDAAASSPEVSASDDRAQRLQQRLETYFQTGRADFGSIEVDAAGWTPFQTQVYRECRKIPCGQTLTYKDLASRAGRAAASRAVGAAMARNRLLIVIPCHRVISVGGKLRGFSAPGGLTTKRFLLDLEAS